MQYLRKLNMKELAIHKLSIELSRLLLSVLEDAEFPEKPTGYANNVPFGNSVLRSSDPEITKKNEQIIEKPIENYSEQKQQIIYPFRVNKVGCTEDFSYLITVGFNLEVLEICTKIQKLLPEQSLQIKNSSDCNSVISLYKGFEIEITIKESNPSQTLIFVCIKKKESKYI